jgi:hypothetical protein
MLLRGRLRARLKEITMFTGRCLCGGVRFQIDGELQPIQLCYCSQCRQAQGTPFASNIPVRADAFTLLAGDDLLTHFESSPGKERAFCRRCGSPVYSRRTTLPGMLRVRAGLIEQPLGVKPVSHAYVADKADWWTIFDDLPQFPGAAP